MIKLPNTVPMPAPEPATPTVAAPAPINLAAVSMSRETTLVWNSRLATWSGTLLQGGCSDGISGLLRKEADTGLIRPLVQERSRAGEMSSAPVVCIFSVCREKRKNPLAPWWFAYSGDLRSSPSPRPSSLDHALPRMVHQLRRTLEVRRTGRIPGPPLSARQVCKGRSWKSEVQEGGPAQEGNAIPRGWSPGKTGR